MKTPVIPGYEVLTVEGPPQGKWTYADWEKLGADDDNRYEIINGYLYMTTAPSFFHQSIILDFYDLVGAPAKQQGLARVALAPVGLLMPGCDPVQPDFVLILKEHESIIHDGRIRGVPDLIVEVLSPGSVDYDEGVKLEAYANAGVPEYIVIAPRERKLRLYSLEHPGKYADPHEFTGDDLVKFACLPAIEFRLSTLFENAPDTTV
ncbi:MAG TPA: Uma2 family endonuclease [Phototrophicaceae bacterium]|nr:Uma2 family endonuclease [Phototrophicaceae bacterium]